MLREIGIGTSTATRCATVDLTTSATMNTNEHAPAQPILMRTLLVAMDSGPGAADAARAGLDLAERFGARVEFIHAVGSPAMPWRSEEDPRAVSRGEDLLTRARERTVEIVSEAATGAARVALDVAELVHVASGPPAAVILERARAMSADVIVLGALRSRRGLEFGSTARAVLAKAPGAVWAQAGPISPMSRILVPFDFSRESEIALATAIDLAARSHARVTVMHCFDPVLHGDDLSPDLACLTSAEFEQRHAADFRHAMWRVDWHGVDHHSTFVTGNAADCIVEFEKDRDLVVMGTHGRTGLSAAVLGNVAYSVLRRSAVPVLAVRDTERAFRFD